MILSTILNYVRAQAQTDSNGLTDAKGIIFANEALQDFHRRLVHAGVDASQTQESYTSGTAGQGTYLYPTDMLFLKTLSVNYLDQSNSNYLVAQQIDVSNIAGGVSFEWLRTNQSTLWPQFDDRGDQFEIFPTPLNSNNVTNMFRIFYYLRPTEYTSVGDTVSYPENLDTTLLGWRICADYLYSLGNEMAVAFNEKYDERVKEYVQFLSRGTQQPMQATGIQSTGWNF